MSNLETINALIQTVVSLAPKFLEDPKDFEIAQGNLALYILDSEGNMYGRMFGDDRSKQRISGRTAWHKVTQVWLTNKPTGVYEKLVYNNEVNWWEFGVPKSEFIGWEGGMPAVLEDGTRLAIAISGMHGETDRQLIRDAAAKVGGIKIIED
jgi:uncharacterized protein GlcG (DUF336 family)